MTRRLTRKELEAMSDTEVLQQLVIDRTLNLKRDMPLSDRLFRIYKDLENAVRQEQIEKQKVIRKRKEQVELNIFARVDKPMYEILSKPDKSGKNFFQKYDDLFYTKTDDEITSKMIADILAMPYNYFGEKS